MRDAKLLHDGDGLDAKIEWVRDLRPILAEASFSEDYELGETEIENLNLLLNQYLLVSSGVAANESATARKLQQRLESSVRNFMDLYQQLQKTPEGGRWLLSVFAGAGQPDEPNDDARLMVAADPLEVMQAAVDRMAILRRQSAPLRTGPKDDAAFEVLARRLYRFWQQVRQKVPDAKEDRRSCEETYDLVQRTLAVIGKDREIKSLRNIVPADPTSRYWLPPGSE